MNENTSINSNGKKQAPQISIHYWFSLTYRYKKKSQNLQRACLCNSGKQNTYIICDAEVYNPVLADVMEQITVEKKKEKKSHLELPQD